MADSMQSESLAVQSPVVPSAKRVSAGGQDNIVVAIKGDIDLKNSPDLRNALIGLIKDKMPARLILDLSSVTYMDSSAIAVLVEMLQKLKKAGGKVCLIHVQPRVKGLLEIARLDTIFVLAKDEVEAMSK
jgi:anti-sigma B factor antagonist